MSGPCQMLTCDVIVLSVGQSTPAVAKRRFLAYNSLGQITSRDETTYHVVEIEFADVNTGRPVRFNDYNGFTMAAMVSSYACDHKNVGRLEAFCICMLLR